MADIELLRFKKLLRNNGHFVTRPRVRMFGLLQHHPAITTKRLLQLVEVHDRATVYRNIELFEKLGIINRLQLGWHTKLELSDVFQHHHHHISCTKCGKVWALQEDQVIEKRIHTLASAKYFEPTDHQLEIRGICKACTLNS